MLKDTASVCGHEIQIETTGHSAIGLQPVRISPLQGGAWALPGFSPDIPSIIEADQLAATQQSLSAFGLCAHTHGVKLPRTTFKSVGDAITRQWKNHIKLETGKYHCHLPIHVELTATGDRLLATVSASYQLQAFVLRPMVDQLNQVLDGLGWWATQVAMSVGGNGVPLYTLRDIPDYHGYNVGWCESFTDEDYLSTLRENEGEENLTREYVDENFHVTWPSELIAEAGGHGWLFGQTKQTDEGLQEPLHPIPYMPTTEEVTHWLASASDIPEPVRSIVEDFIALNNELKRADTMLHQAKRPSEDSDDPYHEPGELIGSIGFLAWDEQHDLAWEVLRDWGDQAFNSGEATEESACYSVPLHDANAHERLVNYLKDLVCRVGTIARAFRHLKV